MFLDIVIHESVVSDVIMALVSKLETTTFGDAISFRKVCSWQPADNLLEEAPSSEQVLAFDVARSNVQLLATRPALAIEIPTLYVPGGAGEAATRPPNRGRFTLSLAGNVASSAALYWAGTNPTPPDIHRRTFNFSITAKVESLFDAADAAFRNVLTLNVAPDGPVPDFPAVLGGNQFARLFRALALVPIEIPLKDLEKKLGGIQFVAADVRTDPDSHVAVLRLLFAPVKPWPKPADSEELAFTLSQEYDAFNAVSANTFAAQLQNPQNGTDRIAIVVPKTGFEAVLLSFMHTALAGARGALALENADTNLAFSPLPPVSGIAFASAFNVRAKDGCRSAFRQERQPDGTLEAAKLSDIVATIRAAVSMNIRDGNVELRARVSGGAHEGWALNCGFLQVGELRFFEGAWGQILLQLLFALFPLFVIAVWDAAVIVGRIPPDPRALARGSNGLLSFDEATGELVSRQPVRDFALGAPSAFVLPVPPNSPAGQMPQPLPDLGRLALTSISERNGVVRFGLFLRPDIVAGSLTVVPRVPIGARAPAPGRLADWVWTYRTCEPTFNPALPEQEEHPAVLALSLQIWNERNAQDPFRQNAFEPMDVCAIGLTGAVTEVGGFDPNPIKFDWQLPSNRGPTRAPPLRLTASGTTDRLNLIVYIPYRAFLDQWEISRAPDFGLGAAAAAASRRFLAAPGFLVIRTSAGRRWIELPSLNGFTPAGGNAVVQARRVACSSGARQVNWEDSFAGRDARFRLPGPDPFVLLNRMLNDSVRAQLPRLNLPIRNADGLYSLEQRSVSAVLGHRSPNAAALAGLGPSNLDNIPAPMAAPIGLARLPRRP